MENESKDYDISVYLDFLAPQSGNKDKQDKQNVSVVLWMYLQGVWRAINKLGRVVRKPVNGNPGLQVNRTINFSCIKMFFASCVLFSMRLFKFKREGQTIYTENLSEKLQN